MISLTCTQCKTFLTMDDAFAGGVCRCQHCGTIQTVPSNAKKVTKAQSVAGQKVATQKPLFRARGQSSEAASGLEELADVVASSGLSNSGLSSSGLSSRRLKTSTVAAPPAAAAPAAPPAKPVNKSLASLLITIIVLLVVAIGVGVWLAMRPAQDEISSPSAPTVPSGAPAGPSFADVPLKEAGVIYLLDRGNATAESFDALKAACYRSIELLGPSRRFQILFWDSDSDPAAYPPNGMVMASPDQIDAAKKAFADIQAYGSSRLGGALKKALAQKPPAIVIATGKISIDEKDLAALKDAAKTNTNLYIFSIGDTGPQPDLDAVAKSGGGLHRTSKDGLHSFATHS